MSLSPGSTVRTAVARTRYATRVAPDAVLLWCSSLALLVFSTIANSPQTARWALWVAFVALLAAMVRTARWAVTRLTQIIALWEEDVPLPEVRPLHAVGHRGERARRNA